MRTVLFVDDEHSILSAIKRMYLETHFDPHLMELFQPIAEEARPDA